MSSRRKRDDQDNTIPPPPSDNLEEEKKEEPEPEGPHNSGHERKPHPHPQKTQKFHQMHKIEEEEDWQEPLDELEFQTRPDHLDTERRQMTVFHEAWPMPRSSQSGARDYPLNP